MAPMTGKRAGSGTSMTAVSRLRQDYLRLKRDPVPYVVAEPLPSNLLEWHYVVTGPEKSSYEGGLYHGKLVFPPEFPFKPPAIYMITPNGRFKTDTRLCLSISDYHPDTWNPAWSVATILTGLLSFMLETSPTLGSIETSNYGKKQLALASHPFNLKNKLYRELFPELAEASAALVQERQRTERQREAAGRNGARGDAGSSSDDPLAPSRRQLHGARHEGALIGMVSNLFVIGGFAAFALVVRYVVQSIDYN